MLSITEIRMLAAAVMFMITLVCVIPTHSNAAAVRVTFGAMYVLSLVYMIVERFWMTMY